MLLSFLLIFFKLYYFFFVLNIFILYLSVIIFFKYFNYFVIVSGYNANNQSDFAENFVMFCVCIKLTLFVLPLIMIVFVSLQKSRMQAVDKIIPKTCWSHTGSAEINGLQLKIDSIFFCFHSIIAWFDLMLLIFLHAHYSFLMAETLKPS